MKRRAIFFLLLLIATASFSRAQSDSSKSPKDTLLAQDAAAHGGDLKADGDFYYATDDHQRKLVPLIAKGDVALAKLQDAVSKQFGSELGVALVHAAGTVVAEDIKNAAEKIDGDKATVQFKNDAVPLHMIKIDNAWKVSLADMLGEATIPQIDALAEKFVEFTSEIDKLTDLVNHGKFRSGEGVRDRVLALHDRLFKAGSDAGEGQRV